MRTETSHSFMAAVPNRGTGKTSTKKLTTWNSQCYVTRFIYGLRASGHRCPTYMVEGPEFGFCKASEYGRITGEKMRL